MTCSSEYKNVGCACLLAHLILSDEAELGLIHLKAARDRARLWITEQLRQ